MTSLKGADIREIFDMYDKLFFDGEIGRKLEQTDSEIKFVAKTRESGVAGICGREGTCKYYMEVSPQVLGRIVPSVVAAGLGCTSRLECVQLIVEHLIIHLIMLLWEFAGKEGPIYAEHGELFQCMLRQYFGHLRFDHNLGLTTIDTERTEYEAPVEGEVIAAPLEPKGVYSWHANSCYIDSLLMVLFDSASQFWRDNILRKDVGSIEYPTALGVCDIRGGSQIDTVDKLKRHAKKVQDQLRTDFLELHRSGNVLQCTPLRQLLQECFPDMKPRGHWSFYNVAAAYNLLSELFPDIKTEYPVRIRRWNAKTETYESAPIRYESKALTTAWDFMDPLEVERGADYPEIVWERINSPVIVFYNGGLPRIKKLNEAGRERGFVTIAGIKTFYNIKKARPFEETIINGRYELIGVITLHGVAPNQEGGVHYTAHFKTKGGQWYYYNDSGRIIRKTPRLPVSGVWQESNGNMPSMYFYRRLKALHDTARRLNGEHISISVVGTRVSVKDMTEGLRYAKFMIDEMRPTSHSDNVVRWIVTADRVKSLTDELLALDAQKL